MTLTSNTFNCNSTGRFFRFMFHCVTIESATRNRFHNDVFCGWGFWLFPMRKTLLLLSSKFRLFCIANNVSS